jgi:hypothetical protein
MEMIAPDDVIRRIEMYLASGMHPVATGGSPVVAENSNALGAKRFNSGYGINLDRRRAARGYGSCACGDANVPRSISSWTR